MSDTTGYRLSIGGLITYLIISTICLVAGDQDHALMFIMGGIFWIISIFAWNIR